MNNHCPLSRRQLQILELVARGHSDQEVADRLMVSVHTVKGHLSLSYARLRVRNRMEAISLARKEGWL